MYIRHSYWEMSFSTENSNDAIHPHFHCCVIYCFFFLCFMYTAVHCCEMCCKDYSCTGLWPYREIDILLLLYVINYNDVIMGTMASQITSPTIIYSAVYSGADQRKHQSSASLAFVRGIHRWPVNSPHKWPVTRKMFPFDDVITKCCADHKWAQGFRAVMCE